jgi:glycosyltransferase involved in cell wall biosynthesis
VRAELGIEVRFLGTYRDMARIYGTSDVCVLPTLHEPFGLPVLEAMACGVPVIVSRCAGVAEVISDGSDGMLLEDPTDVQELAAKLRRLVSERKLRDELGVCAAETAKRYPWEAIAEKVEMLYRKVADVA